MNADEDILIDSGEEFTTTGSDTDSAFGSASPSDAFSIISGINDFRFENGRRYHAYSEGHYYAPNDEKQNQQLDIFHHIYTLTIDGEYFLAPIKDPRRILDLGTGTGIWVMDVAERFPKATVIGNDLSPIQPTWVPPNAEFEVDDYTRAWVHPANSFDFIHARGLAGTVADWKKLYGEIFSTLQPGGWFEHVEASMDFECDDDSKRNPSKLDEWTYWMVLASQATGKTFRITHQIPTWFEKTGFTNINNFVYKLPVGSWPKDEKYKAIGQFNLLNMLEGADGWTFALFSRVLRWPTETINKFLDEIKDELKDRRTHGYVRLYFTYGQKPAQ